MKSLLKKMLLFALALALLVPFAACKKQEENPDDGKKPSDDDPPDYVAGEGQDKRHAVSPRNGRHAGF